VTSIRTILVPVDFSPGSMAAARHAHDLATTFHSRVCLLHVTVPTDVSPFATEPYRGKLRALVEPARLDALDQLATLIAEEQFEPFHTDGVVRTGCPEQVISEYAHQINADLIVMGTHGDHAQPVGKVIERVIGRVDCPVMAIPNKETRVAYLRSMPGQRAQVAC
jgi:nucleotide-binding universal stress UspA family protein